MHILRCTQGLNPGFTTGRGLSSPIHQLPSRLVRIAKWNLSGSPDSHPRCDGGVYHYWALMKANLESAISDVKTNPLICGLHVNQLTSNFGTVVKKLKWKVVETIGPVRMPNQQNNPRLLRFTDQSDIPRFRSYLCGQFYFIVVVAISDQERQEMFVLWHTAFSVVPSLFVPARLSVNWTGDLILGRC